jgi:H+/Cl- antiporter ClcA
MSRAVWLIALSAAVGTASGLTSLAFLHALEAATDARLSNDWLLWLLPPIGLVVGLAYARFGEQARRGTPLVVQAARAESVDVPLRMTPMIFAAAALAHLGGASVGREGVALQMAGSLADSGARRVGLDRADRQLMAVAALAAGFGGMFGVPLSGIVFALAMSSMWRLSAVVTASVGACTAFATVEALGWEHMAFPTLPRVALTWQLPPQLVALGVVLGLCSIIYARGLSTMRAAMERWVRWPPLRPAIGGAATVALALLLGRDYLGLSFGLAEQAVLGVPADVWDPLLKLAFTIIALGCGFHGGELIPLMVVGATASSVVADVVDGPSAVMVAAGFAAVFAASAHTVATGVVLAAELFGWRAAAPALVVTGVARLVVSGRALFDSEHE